MFINPVSEEELSIVAISSLKPKKAAGYDDFKPDIIRNVIHFVAKPLTYICNLSFTSGTFPDNLKIAKVIPIF